MPFPPGFKSDAHSEKLQAGATQHNPGAFDHEHFLELG